MLRLPFPFAILLLTLGAVNANGATTLLPNGEQCFQTATGPVSSGSVNMYFPSTTTPKTTWKDPLQATANTQPIQLDSSGCAIIYGVGSYRQQLYTGPVVGGSTTGNLVFDLLTTDTSAYNATFWAGLAGGTPNVITVSDPGFNGTDGSILVFQPLSANTTSVTLNPSGFGNIPVTQPTATGPLALTSGCLVANTAVQVVYSSVLNTFQLLTPCGTGATATGVNLIPNGYLTLSSDPTNIVLTADAIAATTVYYSPFNGNQVPIYNGTVFIPTTFTQLSLTLTATLASNTIYDVCVFSNSGVPTLAAGPAWTVSTNGNGSRGVGAGTPQLINVNGILVNAVNISGLNGTTTYAIPANQCTYLGSILIDATAGQVTCHVSTGTARKWDVWNAYNQQQIILRESDPTSAWTLSTTTNQRVSNGNANNKITTLMGLAVSGIDVSFHQVVQILSNVSAQTYSGTVTISVGGTNGSVGGANSFSLSNSNLVVFNNFSLEHDLHSEGVQTPQIGINVFNPLESFGSVIGLQATMFGAGNFMLIAKYPG